MSAKPKPPSPEIFYEIEPNEFAGLKEELFKLVMIELMQASAEQKFEKLKLATVLETI